MPKKYSVTIRGHRTSYSIEQPFHDRLLALARRNRIPLAQMVTRIDAGRHPGQNLSSAIRLYVLQNSEKSE